MPLCNLKSTLCNPAKRSAALGKASANQSKRCKGGRSLNARGEIETAVRAFVDCVGVVDVERS